MTEFASGLTLEDIERETGKLAGELAFYARRPVSIQLVAGKHIAFTYGTDQTKKTIPVVMNPSILEKVRHRDRALKIWRGIGFHELAHHLWPAEPQYKAAAAEGYQQLFNLIDDEQNERRARAMDASWGSCFQSVCAFIFPTKDRAEVSTGIADGGVAEKKPSGIAADKIYAKRWGIFAYHFRRHIPDCADKVVCRALDLIPANFKDLSKEELLDLTRKVHNTFCEGLEVPEVPRETPPAETSEEPTEAPDDPADNTNDKADGDTDEGNVEPKTTWNPKRLLLSKWSWITLALAVTGWFFLFMQKGTSFWLQVAVGAGMAFIMLTVFLFIRRAQIKAMLEQMKEAMRKTGPPPDRPQASTLIKILGAAVFASVFSVLAYMLLRALLKDANWIIIAEIAVNIGLFPLCIYVGNHLSRKADRDRKPLNWWSTALIMLMTLASAAVLGWSAWQAGFSMRYLLIYAGVAVILTLGLLLILLGSGKEGAYSDRGLGERLTEGASVLLYYPSLLLAIPAEWLWKYIGPPIKRLFGGIWKGLKAFCSAIASGAKRTWFFVKRKAQLAWVIFSRRFRPLWHNAAFRLAIIAMPIAAILVMIWAVLVKAASINYWLLAALIILLLILLFLLWYFRKKISRFILEALLMPMPDLMQFFRQPPLDMVTDWFNPIDDIEQMEADQAVVDELLPETFALANQLRAYLAACGSALFDREDSPDGHDLIDEVELALLGETNLFVEDQRRPRASVHLEVALDISGSMGSATESLQPGEKFRLGKLFAMVLEQAVINLPGVSAHFWGFNADVIYDCGVAGERRISGLQCGGGNNDSAMLWKMAQSARESGKDVKILLMLSDGQPSDCSWLSLHNLVLKFEQEGMIPWNFGLDRIDTPAFERFFTDLVGQSQEEAVLTMGQTLAQIAQAHMD